MQQEYNMNDSSGVEFALYAFRIGETGVTWLDLMLLVLCPLGGLLGTLVGSEMQRKQIIKDISENTFAAQSGFNTQDEAYPHNRKEVRKLYEDYVLSEYRLISKGNGVIGIAIGFAISLYFLGAITQDITSLARVTGLCIILGYMAPNFLKNPKIG